MSDLHLFDPGPKTDTERDQRRVGSTPRAIVAHARAEARAQGMSRDRRLTFERQALMDAGFHPLTRLPLADNDETCATCAHLIGRSGTWRKCAKHRRTSSRTTDVVLRWPACQLWTAPEEGARP